MKIFESLGDHNIKKKYKFWKKKEKKKIGRPRRDKTT